MAAQEKPLSSAERQRPQPRTNYLQNNMVPVSGQELTNLTDAAIKILSFRFSVIPTHADKTPALPSWNQYQKKRMTVEGARSAFQNGYSLALVAGAVSGNLECIDFDKPDLFKPFMDTLERIAPKLGGKLVKRKTPSGGYHLIYRCESTVGGNQKLAVSEDGKDTWIETRGEGGYFLTSPSKGYTVIEHSLMDISVLTKKDVKLLHTLAQSFTRRPEERVFPRNLDVSDTRPGSDYNEQHEMSAILPKYDWRSSGKTGPGGQHWTRPGKDKGTSATLKNECLYVFSTNAGLPLGPNDAFGIYAHSEHRGDFKAAAKELARQGYGQQTSQLTQTSSDWEPSTPSWPMLGGKALSGIAGEFVDLATEHSEADPAAVLATFLVRFGVEVGSGPQMWVGDTPHRCRLASVIVGASSKARKGTSGKPVSRLFSSTPLIGGDQPHTPAQTTPGPFSSGEGIIYLVRDEIKKWKEKEQKYAVIDPGVNDKRLFILDEEFAGVMANTKREGNTLSMIIRQMWDSGNLAPIIKNNRTTATDAHIGWVSHITLNELNLRLNESEAFNGFANRILWVCAKRRKLVPLPEPMDERRLLPIQRQIFGLAGKMSGEIGVRMDNEAKGAWVEQYYRDLTKSKPGLIGCVVNRAEAQVLRLVMIYALLDGSSTFALRHLESAIAFWNYCEQSAYYIFHGREADHIAQKILKDLEKGPKTATEIHRLFSSHENKERLEMALSELSAADTITVFQNKTKGRPVTWYKLTESHCVKSVLSAKRVDKGHNTLFTLNTQASECHSDDEWEDI